MGGIEAAFRRGPVWKSLKAKFAKKTDLPHLDGDGGMSTRHVNIFTVFHRCCTYLYRFVRDGIAIIHRSPALYRIAQNVLAHRSSAEPIQQREPHTVNEEAVDAANINNRWSLYEPQSSVDRFNVTINTPSKEMTEQITTFHDQNPAYEYTVESQPDSTYGVTDTNDAELGNFFERPLKIGSFEWGTNDFIYEKFNPWQLYFENPRVINRIANFKLLRCKLHLRFLINGNGFHYGRAIASYNPLHTLDEFTIDRAFISQDVIAASQRPHIYLDPTTSQGGDMCLPFFWLKNALNICEEEWRNMGEVVIQSIQNLKHANGATDRVTISVFAWATEVTLSMPTSSNPGQFSPQSGLEPQSGKKKANNSKSQDEYGTGIISKPASVLAKIAGMLKEAPVIGPYARATQIAAGATAQVASMFGYSRPAVIEDIRSYKPTYMGNLANANMPDTVQRLTMDAKQEVTIDPRTVGLSDTDEMAIVPLAMRESYVTQFPWTVDTQTETLLWNSLVTPAMFDVNTASNPDEIHMTPSCWVSLPFRWWRGSMKFRFQVVASQYHKGRLKVVYEPYRTASNEYNTNYTYIIDIAEQKDFTVKIGWGSDVSYNQSRTPSLGTLPFYETPINAAGTAYYNGIIKVYVVNELTVPNSTVNNDISINVFTSMCEDFEVGGPDDTHIQDFAFAPTPTAPAEGVWPLGISDLCREKNERRDRQRKREREAAKNRPSAVSNLNIDDYLDYTITDTDGFGAYGPQSGVESFAPGDEENTDNPSAPMTETTDVALAAPELSEVDGTTSIYLGESIPSLRLAMKRYNLHTVFGQTATGTRNYKRTQNDLPFYRGFTPDGVHSAIANGSSAPYNRCKTTLINWVLPAYAGWRGAMRWKYQVATELIDISSTGFQLKETFLEVKRWGEELSAYNEDTSQVVPFDDANYIAYENLRDLEHGLEGVTRSVLSQNPVVEAELPWYSNLRFFPAKKKNLTTSLAQANFHQFNTQTDVFGQSGINYHSYCSIGEDFSTFFFLGAPIVYNVGRDDPAP